MSRTNKRNFSNRAQRRRTRQRLRTSRANRTTKTRRQPSRVSRGGAFDRRDLISPEDSLKYRMENPDSMVEKTVFIDGKYGVVSSKTATAGFKVGLINKKPAAEQVTYNVLMFGDADELTKYKKCKIEDNQEIGIKLGSFIGGPIVVLEDNLNHGVLTNDELISIEYDGTVYPLNTLSFDDAIAKIKNAKQTGRPSELTFRTPIQLTAQPLLSGFQMMLEPGKAKARLDALAAFKPSPVSKK